jgi:hypothetical protein
MAVGLMEHHVPVIVYDQSDPKEWQKLDELFKLPVREAAAEGYGEYRIHINYMDTIASTYGWIGSSLMKMHETIKDALEFGHPARASSRRTQIMRRIALLTPSLTLLAGASMPAAADVLAVIKTVFALGFPTAHTKGHKA